LFIFEKWWRFNYCFIRFYKAIFIR